MDLQSILNQALSGGAINQMSRTLGTDESTTSNAVQVALPLLLGALARNSSTPEGSSSLLGAVDRDHDGGILDNVGDFFGGGNADSGTGILGHVFGGGLGGVQQGVSRSSGMDLATTGRLLALLAPVVMGALGRAKSQGHLSPETLPATLNTATEQTSGSAGMAGMIAQMLDADKDGSAVDDVMRMASNFFGRQR